ncbi:uncharacterized protein LOC141809557 [Halichoeres trimaculatus]|uniref:uncharacterized protein LOC141809557 n=1 Tax=Halichoeres trimaculatus TaxID=147232 RepID=UPI003D9EE785
MTPPKPPRKNSTMKSTSPSPSEDAQVTCGDPDASEPALTDHSQLEVIVKPVPRPRTKKQPKDQSNHGDSTPTAPSEDSVSAATNGDSPLLTEYPADHKRPRPARPPPPRASSLRLTSSQPTSQSQSTLTETTAQSPAEGSGTRPPSLRARPERPPPPSIYYDRLPSTAPPQSEGRTDEAPGSRWSNGSMRQTSVSPAPSEDDGSLSGASDSTDSERPAVPPRIRHSSLPCPTSEYESSPRQIRPPPPTFSPPPPPSTGTPSESIYSEIQYRPYLDVLPEDNLSLVERNQTQRWSTMGSVQHFPSGFYTLHPLSSDDTEDVNRMLRWLKRMSKSDSMAPSLYGLSIEEEVRSFNQRAMNVRKALRLFNLLMMKRNETLRDIIAEFNAICESLDKVHKMTKTMGIAGGTTGAVGGVTAVLGIALAGACNFWRLAHCYCCGCWDGGVCRRNHRAHLQS